MHAKTYAPAQQFPRAAVMERRGAAMIEKQPIPRPVHSSGSVLMTAIQLVSARIGGVTGKRLATNQRQHYPAPLLYIAVLLLLLANTINIAADLAAMGAAAKLVLGRPAQLYVVLLGTFSLMLQIFVPYERYARLLKWLTLSLFSYVAVAFVIPIDWKAVGLSLVVPHITMTRAYVTMVVAVLGMTISRICSSGRRPRKWKKFVRDRRGAHCYARQHRLAVSSAGSASTPG
jgi:hypothetical protein